MRALKFGLVGIGNTAVDFLLFSWLTGALGISAVAANLVSYSAGSGSSFFLNRRWTFRDRAGLPARTQLLWFIVGSVAGLAVSTALVGLLAGALPPLVAKAISVLATFVWNYGFSILVAFRR